MFEQVLGRDRVFFRDFMSRQGIVMLRHSLVKTKGFYVATGYCYVVTEFGQDQGILCHDRVFLCLDGILSRRRDFVS